MKKEGRQAVTANVTPFFVIINWNQGPYSFFPFGTSTLSLPGYKRMKVSSMLKTLSTWSSMAILQISND